MILTDDSGKEDRNPGVVYVVTEVHRVAQLKAPSHSSFYLKYDIYFFKVATIDTKFGHLLKAGTTFAKSSRSHWVLDVFSINFADDLIRTADLLWNRMQAFYQLSHNHCPRIFTYTTIGIYRGLLIRKIHAKITTNATPFYF